MKTKGLAGTQVIREAFAYNLGSGQDLGASVAIAADGELVVDLWGGYLDANIVRAAYQALQA